MTLPIRLDQLRGDEVRIALCRAQAGVSEQLLDRPQIGAARDQVRGKRGVQLVRADAEPGAALSPVLAHEAIDAPRRQALTLVVQEQRHRPLLAAATPSPESRLPGPESEERLPVLQPGSQRLFCRVVERDDALLAS